MMTPSANRRPGRSWHKSDANQENSADPASQRAVAASERRARPSAACGRHVRRPVVVRHAQGDQDHHRQHRPASPADQLLPEL